jgi:hypothetical protein
MITDRLAARTQIAVTCVICQGFAMLPGRNMLGNVFLNPPSAKGEPIYNTRFDFPGLFRR